MNTTTTIQTFKVWNLIRMWSSCNIHTVGGIVHKYENIMNSQIKQTIIINICNQDTF